MKGQSLRQILDNIPAGIVETDARGYITMVNRRWCDMLGYTEAELIGRSVFDVTHETSRKATHDAVAELAEGGADFLIEKNYIRKDGTVMPAESSVSAKRTSDGSFAGLIAIVIDITERRRMEAERDRLAAIVSFSNVAIVSKTLDSVVTSWNEAATRIFGYSDVEMIGSSIRRIIPPDRQHEEDLIIERIQAGERVEAFETVRQQKGGKIIHVSVAISPILDHVGRVIGASKMALDITERKRFEAERARLAAIVATSNDAIISQSLNGIIESWNQSAERIFQFTSSEMIGTPVLRIIPKDRLEEEENHSERVKQGYRIESYDTKRQRKDGRIIDVSISLSPIYDNVGAIIGMSRIARDITERKRAEARENVLMREVNHRAKNMLSLVQSIARRTVAATPQDFLDRFTSRIQALAATQDLLVKNNWSEISIEELICMQISHFQDLIGIRIKLRGSPVTVSASAAQSIGLAIHELATNAAKYGALSNDTGVIELSWKNNGKGNGNMFAMQWKETGGPPVDKPRSNGFGYVVTNTLIKINLGGDVEAEYSPIGLTWKLTCPAANVIGSRTSEPSWNELS